MQYLFAGFVVLFVLYLFAVQVLDVRHFRIKAKNQRRASSFVMRGNIYDTVIPRNVRLAEAPSYGLPINIYDSKSSGAIAYRALADEVIKNKLFVD